MRDARVETTTTMDCEVADPLSCEKASCTSAPFSVVMFDLLATVPYYSAYLTRALQLQGSIVRLESITYYLDRECFHRCDVRNRVALLDLLGKMRLSRNIRRPLKFIEYVANCIGLLLRLSALRPDVLHVQYLPALRWNFKFELFLLRMAKKLNIPIVYTVHDLLPHDTGETLHDVFAEAYLIPDALICHSEEVKLALMNRYGVPSERIWTIPHGPLFHDHTMEEKHAAPKNGKVLVLWQGIIFPYKGIDFLLESWKKVIDSGARAELLILGTGESELQKAIIVKIEALHLKDSVRLDFRFVELSALLSVYASADIVVYPYEAVTTSGALLTGLSQNKPIIATNLPYFERVLEHGKLGRLVPYGDTDMLAGTLLALINNPDARTQLETAVQSRQFGSSMWDDIARSTLACYSEVTARSHAGS